MTSKHIPYQWIEKPTGPGVWWVWDGESISVGEPHGEVSPVLLRSYEGSLEIVGSWYDGLVGFVEDIDNCLWWRMQTLTGCCDPDSSDRQIPPPPGWYRDDKEV